jgi:outer membrane protein insertion porin family
VGIGKLFPFGKSIPPTPAEGLDEYFQLRDVLFTAGGMGDVRGWSTRLLGPKLPAIFIPVEGDSVGAPTADRYVPIGGFNRTHASVEIRAPIPLLGSAWQAHAFVDAGRVWTHDERFTSSDDPLGVEKLFWAAGIGVDYITIIGAVRVAVARKMNPSIFDLLDPGTAAQAILSGTPFTALPIKNSRRYRIHIGLGRWL